jgi:hypothetical protein
MVSGADDYLTKPVAIDELLAATMNLHAQGSLTPPPGAPAPVMKSLDQVEARTPVVAGQPEVAINGSGTITISQPGSYYLTKNIWRCSGGKVFRGYCGCRRHLCQLHFLLHGSPDW